MKILLVGKRSIQESLGVEKKLDNQRAAFEKLGHQVWYTCAGPDGCFLYGPTGTVKLCEYKNLFPSGRNAPYNNAYMLLAAAEYPGITFDLCYIRKPLCDGLHLKALAAFRQRGTVLIEEIPTYPYDAELKQERGLGPRAFLAIDRFYRKKLGEYLDYIATYSDDTSIFGVPAIPMENAVRVEELLLSVPPEEEEPLALIAVSSLYFWHGYDRLIRGLAAWRRAGDTRSIVLHLVGSGPELENWRALALSEGVADAVIFHGAQTGPALDAIYDRCHLAVASLGWYRKEMGERPTFEIKIRDYISRGKPFLYACTDPHAQAVAPYSLRLPNDESPIDIERMIAFYEDIRQKDYTQFLRLYALDNLRWEPQMQKVLDAAARVRRTNAVQHPSSKKMGKGERK